MGRDAGLADSRGHMRQLGLVAVALLAAHVALPAAGGDEGELFRETP